MYLPLLSGVVLGMIIGGLLTVLIMSLMFSVEMQWREIDDV
jgi:high-affinity Fe2+/Pb2+ permease